ncbi:MAG TPA: IPT/TIG domain-containing protein [Gaiellaceae bacterium]|nr:IPT/TIG domain-containing protein [Gaiellaceae bacterium]
MALVVSASVLGGSALARPSVAAPSIISFTPTHAMVGATVTIYGHNLTGAQVQFNGMNAKQVTVDSTGTHVKAIIDPETMDGPSQIGIITPGGTVNSTMVFTVDPPTGAPAQTGRAVAEKPLIKSITPIHARVGAKVTIKGANLGGAMWVKFGGVKALYTVPSASKIIARVPKKAHTGRISVKTSVGVATHVQPFLVTIPLG